MEFLFEYGMFFAKTVTVVIAMAIVISLVVASKMKGGDNQASGNIEIKKINEKFEDVKQQLESVLLDKDALKQIKKDKKAQDKQSKKEAKQKTKKDNADIANKARLFVLDFNGDIKASAVEMMRQEISAVLMVANEKDEVLINLESGGGMVHSYGLAASQLQRIRDKNIALTICIDKVAASGGYMMACVADKIIAAPFAIVGSIGVIAQLPNFNRLLKKHDVDYEMITAGDYKRTLTMFGENTDKGREKFKKDIEDTHVLFKEFVKTHRDVVDIDDVATGEIWYGSRAVENKLVDQIQTSDQYIIDSIEAKDVYKIAYITKKSVAEKLGMSMQVVINAIADAITSRLTAPK